MAVVVKWDNTSLATGYKPFQACSVCMDAGLSVFSVIDLRFFCESECIRTLTQPYVYQLGLITVVSTCMYNPQ